MTKITTGGHPDMKMVNSHAAAVDIGSTTHMAAVNPDTCETPVRAFGTFTQDLHDLATWFRSCGVTSVAMESTSVYWIPADEIAAVAAALNTRPRKTLGWKTPAEALDELLP